MGFVSRLGGELRQGRWRFCDSVSAGEVKPRQISGFGGLAELN